MTLTRVGPSNDREYAIVRELIDLAMPAVVEAEKRDQGAESVSLCIWASPCVIDVHHHHGAERRLAVRIWVVDERVAVLLAEFLSAGLNRLPKSDRLAVLAMAHRNHRLSLAAELDITFGGAIGVMRSLDQQQRVELFQLAEAPH